MFKALLTTLTVTLATSLFAENSPDPSGWYTPKDYQAPNGYEATAAVTDARGKIHQVSFTVSMDEDGNVLDSSLQDALGDIKLSIQSAVSLIDEMIKGVCQNAADIDYIFAMISTLGENLTKVFMTKGLSVKIGDKTYNLKIQEGALRDAVQTSSTITHVDENGLFHVPDEMSISRLPDGQTELKGWSSDDATKTLAEAENVSVPVRTAKNAPLEYRSWNGVDKQSINIDAKTKKLELESWSKKTVCKETLSELLLSDSSSQRASHHIVTRFNGTIHYLPIGDAISAGGVSVDGTSITTNLFDGAEDEKSASLFGWTFAPTLGIPYKASSETLDWVSQSDIVDNKSIGFVDGLIPGGTLGKFEIKGASLQTANNRYFGTPAKGAVSLGWYDLPNVTTNAVEGDEKTITTVSNEDGIKRLGWKYLPPVAEWPSAARGLADGSIEWVPLTDFPTNSIAAVDNITITTNDSAALQLKGWEKFGHGVIGKAQNGSLVCKTPSGTNGVEHIENESILAFGLAGFVDGNNCEKNLADLLRSGDKTHKVLARYGDGGANPTLHYLPLGKLSAPPLDNATLKTNDTGHASIANFKDAAEGGVLTKRGETVAWEVAAAPDIDNKTIVTNTALGAVSDGALSIAGFSGAADGKVLTKRGDGVTWEDGGLKPDCASIATNAQGNLTISGFVAAADATIPVKKNASTLGWKNLNAGYGMKIDSSDGALTISTTLDTPDTAGAFSSISYISDIRYDATEHKLIVVKTTVSAKVLNDATTEEITVFTATPHSLEHTVVE